MKEFRYTIKDEHGIHARPAGMLAKAAKALDSSVTISHGGRSAPATKLMALMSMGIKRGDEITVAITGGDEEAAEAAMRAFLEENL